MGTIITKKVVDDLGLRQTGVRTLRGVGSGDVINEIQAPTYLVNLVLPNHVVLKGVPVAVASLGTCDILLGMDVIGIGDFAVSHQGEGTMWSFRFPSCGEVDFVPEIQRHNDRLGRQSLAGQEQRRKSRNKNKSTKRKRRRT